MRDVITAIGIAIKLAAYIVGGNESPCYITYYGTESDGFLGARHGASWHGDACGLPEEVDEIHYGVAAPRWIPYCTKVLVCYKEVCIVVTVVDRMADDRKDGMPRLDLWPAAAAELGMVEAGIVEGVVVLSDDQD